MILIAFLLLSSMRASSQEHCENVCAKDAAYKDFEYLQCADYNSNPVLREMWKDTTRVNSAFKSIEKLYPGTSRASKTLKKELFAIQLPTCYENRLAYYYVTIYLNMIRSASIRIKKQTATPLKYGTLPSTEINASTIITSNDDRLVAFNTQLFAFSLQMAHVVAPLVQTQLRVSGTSAWSPEAAGQIVDDNKPAQQAFVVALLEFLEVMRGEQLLTVPGTAPLNEMDQLAMDLSTGMDLFAVGHEYSHVILKHTPVRTKLLDVGPQRRDNAAPITARVAILPWEQELAADALGFQLASEAAKELRPESKGQQDYILYGALYFFACMEMLDEGKYILDHGINRPLYTDDEKQYLRSVASGTVTDDQQKEYWYLPLQDHPPAWLRMERIRQMMQAHGLGTEHSNEVEPYIELGESMINYAELIWNKHKLQLPSVIQRLRTEPAGRAGPNDR